MRSLRTLKYGRCTLLAESSYQALFECHSHGRTIPIYFPLCDRCYSETMMDACFGWMWSGIVTFPAHINVLSPAACICTVAQVAASHILLVVRLCYRLCLEFIVILASESSISFSHPMFIRFVMPALQLFIFTSNLFEVFKIKIINKLNIKCII